MSAGEDVADADALAGPDAFAPLRVALAALRMLGAAAGGLLPGDPAVDPATLARVLAGVAAGAAARVVLPKQRRALLAAALGTGGEGPGCGGLAPARAALRAEADLRRDAARAMVPVMNRIVAGARAGRRRATPQAARQLVQAAEAERVRVREPGAAL